MKLYHVPNIVLGIKLRNKLIKFIICNISFRYWLEDINGSLSINDQSLNEYINKLINGCILIERDDVEFKLFSDLTSKNILNCIAYSYKEIDEIKDIEEFDLHSVVDKLTEIIELNLTELLSTQNITISEVNIEY